MIRLISKLFLVALVIGAAAASSATGRVTWALVASTTVCWAFVPILQAMTGTAVLLSAPQRPPLVEGLDAWFALHGPWSIFMLATGAVLMFVPMLPVEIILVPALFAGALTTRAMTRFAVTHLGDTRRSARRRIAIHQVATFAIIFVYFAVVTALAPRVIAWLQ